MYIRNVCIDLGCFNGFVTQQLLNNSYIYVTLKKMNIVKSVLFLVGLI